MDPENRKMMQVNVKDAGDASASLMKKKCLKY
jgi:hypothetical protein